MGTSNDNELDTLRARLDALQTVCAEAYQFAGAVGAPVRVLDNLLAAADGSAMPHETMLPVSAEECDEVARLTKLLRGHHAAPAPGRRDLAAAALGRSGGRTRTPEKSRASRVNGSKGGRPGKFVAGDAVRVNDKAPGDYEGRVGKVLGRTRNRSEFNVRFNDGQRPRTGALMSWWLDPRP